MAAKKTASKVKKKVSKGKPAAKMAAKSAAKKLPAIKEALSKGAMMKVITETTEVSKKDATAVLDCLSQLIEKHVKGPGVFVMSGLMKISVVKKPARPARDGINPFTGESIRIKAKPAYKAIKIRPLKKLKEMVA